MAAITTPRLHLRPARPGDAEALHEVFRRPEATRYWSTPPHRDLAETQAWLDGMLAIPAGEGEDFVVERDGRVIGKAGLYRFPEIGFILHPDHWGQGLAGEAVGAVLDRAFGLHGLPRVVADVDPRNAASLALLARLGFRETGRRERSWLVGGEWCDSVDLALPAERWIARDGGRRR
jgi:RimJ/RimL family protein N-acetyltransferase